jgi:hypothetical protein
MRSPPLLLVASLLGSPAVAGCATPRTQRRDNATLAVAAGAGMFVLGALVTQEEDNSCADDSDGFCLYLDQDDHEILGGLVMITGGVIGTAGLVQLVSAPAAPPQATTQPCSRTPARGACATPPPSDRRRTP